MTTQVSEPDDKNLRADSHGHRRGRPLLPAALAFAILLAALAVGIPPPASAATETIIPTVEAAPGTVSGNPGDLAVADNVRVTIGQQDITALVDVEALVYPDGDGTQTAWSVESDPLRICLGGEHFCTQVDVPLHDGNTSFVSASGAGGLIDEFNMAAWTTPTDITMTAVEIFSWAKKNASGVDGYSFRLTHGASGCASLGPTLTQAFANWSVSYALDCDGTAWIGSDIGGLIHENVYGGGLAEAVVVTASGIIVHYSDSDYQVLARLNFTSIPCTGGCDFELRWRGWEDGPDAALLQVDADGVWTTIATLDDSGDASGSYTIPAEYRDLGAIYFRIIDTVLDDEAGGNVYLDVFAVDITPEGSGGTGLRPVEVSCTYQWTSGNLHCTAIVRLAESLIDGRLWLLDDRVVAQGRPGSHSIDMHVGSGFAPLRGSWNVTLRVITIVGSVLVGETLATADSMWLWGVYGLFFVLGIILIANRYRPPTPRSEPPRETPKPDPKRGKPRRKEPWE